METTDKTIATTPEITPDAGMSDAKTTATVTLPKTPGTSVTPASDPTITKSDDKDKLTVSPIDPTDSDNATASKADASQDTGDFYDRFEKAQDQAKFTEDMQSADTYWNNRPDAQEKYTKDYGTKAKEKFDADYKVAETDWRKKLNIEQDKVVINDRFSWLFDNPDIINYNTAPVFQTVHQIANGSRKIDTLLTDKQMSDRQAALGSRTFVNDQGKEVELKPDEKYWKWSAGNGIEMNYDDPKYKSKDGRKIVGFTYNQMPEQYRGTATISAVYEGDKPKGEIVSAWDTCVPWMTNNGISTGGLLHVLPVTAIRTVTSAAIDAMTGGVSMLRSFAQFFDKDDKNEFIDWANDFNTKYSSLKLSESDNLQQHPYTLEGALNMGANIAGLIYAGSGMFAGASTTLKSIGLGSRLLEEASFATKLGDSATAAAKLAQYEMKIMYPARIASSLAINLEMGNSIVEEARRAGFSEKETAALYFANFAALYGVSAYAEHLVEPFFSRIEAKPLIRKMVAEHMGTADWMDASKAIASKNATKVAVDGTEKAKWEWAKSLGRKMVGAATDLPATSAKFGDGLGYKMLNSALVGEGYWFGGEVVKNFGSMYSAMVHKGEKDIPKFDNVSEEGYWARQLPAIVTNAAGGAMAGVMTAFLPGFEKTDEKAFLIKGDEKEKMMKVAMLGGNLEKMLLKTLMAQKKSGALGSNALSVKMNEKTGEFYKMTDPQAADTMSHAEASYRTIMNQYMVYKTLYAGAANSYDALMKDTDSKFSDVLEYQKDHVLHGELINLHNHKRDLIETLKQNGSIPPAEKPKAKSEPTPPKEQPTVESTAEKSAVTVEPEEVKPEDVKKGDKAFEELVKTKAEQYQTTDFKTVRDLITTEKRIDDILSGNATSQQLARSIARMHSVNVFMTDGQKAVLTTRKDSTGKEMDNPYLSFGDDLLEKIFSADYNLAKGHESRYASYIKSAQQVADIIRKPLTEESLKSLVAGAIKKSNSIAIDRSSNQLKLLKDGANNLAMGLIGKAKFQELVDNARVTFELDADTKTYQDQIGDIYGDWTLEYIPEGVDEASRLTKEAIEAFVEDNLDLIHKLSMSTLLDKLAENPLEMLSANIVPSATNEFKTNLIDSIDRTGRTTVGKYDIDEQGISKAELDRDKLQAELESIKIQEPKTAKEREIQQRELDRLRNEIQVAEGEIQSQTITVKMTGPLDRTIGEYGAQTIQKISSEAKSDDVVPVVKSVDLKVNQAKEIVQDYSVVIHNIAPIVPTVQKLGAVTNLLNEITVNGPELSSTTSKIIAADQSELAYTTLPSGERIATGLPPTRVDQLENSIIRPRTPLAEFRNIEEAKALRDAIDVRLGQVTLLSHLIGDMGTLYKYTKEHIPEGNVRYDHIPKFMAEHVFDGDRLRYLKNKAVLTQEEQADYDEMGKRINAIVNFDDPTSIYSRLNVARTRVQKLINMGEESLTANKRTKVYKTEVANKFNAIRSGLKLAHIEDLDDSLKPIIANINSITDQFTDSEVNGLVKGKNLFDDLQRAIFDLPKDIKDKYLSEHDYYDLNSHTTAANTLVMNSITANVDDFNNYYKQVLSDVIAKDPNASLPTYTQECMLKEAFSFLIDPNNSFNKIHGISKPLMFFVNGGSGTGKTTMIGYALAAAQKYAEVKNKAKVSYVENAGNKVLFAGNYDHQGTVLRDRCISLGVRPSETVGLDKYTLFKKLEKTDDLLRDISTIAFDEATFIQSTNDEGKSELEILHDRVAAINELRFKENLDPIKLILIGDDEQGGWQKGMPTIDSTDEEKRAPTNYDKLEPKVSIKDNGIGIPLSQKLEYSFRGICDKIPSISQDMLSVSNEQYSSLVGKQPTSKLSVASGRIGNDKSDRELRGGVDVARNAEELYNDSVLLENLKLQLEKDKNFKAIIVDDRIREAKDLDNYKGLQSLVNANPNAFSFHTIESVQGKEADYVLANVSQLFPALPIRSMADKSKLQRLAMVVSRARLFAKIVVKPEAQIEHVPNSIIMMLTPEDATALATEWNDFYLNKFHNISATEPKSKTDTGEAAKETTTDNTSNEYKEKEDNIKEQVVPESDKVFSGDYNLIKVQQPIPVSYAGVNTNPDVITDLAAQNVVEAQNKVINDPNADDEQKQKATKIKESIKSTYVSTVDLIGDVAPKTIELESAIEDNSEVSNTELNGKNKIKETAKSVSADLMKKHRILMSYSRIAPHAILNNDNHTALLANYASDVWGWRKYKEVNSANSNNTTGRILTEAKDGINEAIKATLGMQEPGKRERKDYKYSLVSFQTYDPMQNDDVVVHQIYAERADKTKFPVLAIPSTKDLDLSDPFTEFLFKREQTVKNLSDILCDLEKTPKTSKLVSNNQFGFSGVPLTNEELSKIDAGLLSIKSLKVTPKNTETTKYGRTALSGEPIEFKTGDYERKDGSLGLRKISETRQGSGLCFVETALSNIDNIFRATTAGKPLRDSEGGKINFVNSKAIGNFLPNEDKYESPVFVRFNSTAETGKDNYKHLTNSSLMKMMTGADKDFMKSATVGNQQYKLLKVGGHMIMTFRGEGGRAVSLDFTGKGKNLELVFGFDKNGNTIKASEDSSIIEGDMEMSRIEKLLWKSEIDIAKLPKDMISPNLTPVEANEILGKFHDYGYISGKFDPNVLINSYSETARLEAMSKQFVGNKVRSFASTKLDFDKFKFIMNEQHIQVSDPLVFTKTTKGGHEGKAFVLYTRHHTSKFDLQDIGALNKVIQNFAVQKAKDFAVGEFDPTAFTRNGIGIVMLDTKPQSITELLTRIKDFAKEDVNRATSPTQSATNRRMVAFARELTQLVHEVKGIDSSDQFHTRLKDLGMKEDGTPHETIFSNESKERIKSLLKDHPIFDQLFSLMSAITADEHMGKMLVVSLDQPEEIQELFSKPLDERLEYWKDNLQDIAKKDPSTLSDYDKKVRKSIDKFGLSESSLSNLKETDPLHEGTLFENVLTNKETGVPIVTTSGKGIISFIPSEILSRFSGKQIHTEGVFNMVNFLNAINETAVIHGTTTRDLGLLLDDIMKNYSNKGTLNRGILWSGRLSNELDRSLGVSKLVLDDANTMLQTSVKEIDLPSVLISIPDLVKELTKTPAITEVNKPVTSMDKALRIKASLEPQLQKLISDVSEGTNIEGLEKLQKSIARNIGTAFKGLDSDSKITTMVNDMKSNFDNQIKNMIDKIPKESVLPEPVVENVNELRKNGWASIPDDQLLTAAQKDIDDIITLKDAQSRSDGIEAIKQELDANSTRFSDKDFTTISDQLQDKQSTMSKVPETSGQSFLKSIVSASETLTEKQKNVMMLVSKAIDTGALSPEVARDIPEVMEALSNRLKVMGLSDGDRIKLDEKMINVATELGALARKSLSKDMADVYERTMMEIQSQRRNSIKEVPKC